MIKSFPDGEVNNGNDGGFCVQMGVAEEEGRVGGGSFIQNKIDILFIAKFFCKIGIASAEQVFESGREYCGNSLFFSLKG